MSDSAEMNTDQLQQSAWSPLKHKTFTVIWLATLLSNIGTWMNDVGAGWLMTSMTPSPIWVALVQTATTLPIFIFALPAGALADIVNKRKLLLTVQVIMSLLACAFALLVWLEAATPVLLLVFVFLLGSCAAFFAPAMQSVIPTLVPKEELQSAIALGSVGMNVSRAIGPALAGLLIVTLGMTAPFLINALSFIAIIAALLWWKPPLTNHSSLPAEQLMEAMRSGIRYTKSSAAMKATLLRASVFFFFASTFWALIPLIAKNQLAGDATLYGIMLAAIGCGAVLGAVVMPKFKQRLGPDKTVAFGTIVIALVMLISAISKLEVIVIAGCFAYGMGWIAVLSTLNVSAQTAIPDWVRARGLSVYLAVFFGSMSLGSLVWGQISSLSSIPTALCLSALLSVVAIPLLRRAKLQQGSEINLAPSMHWPQPIVSGEVAYDQGPVMTTIEYCIPDLNRDRFLALAKKLRNVRKRNGAYAWDMTEDVSRHGIFIEYFIESSWLAHLRHHERVSEDDKGLQQEIRNLLAPNIDVKVTHSLSQIQ